MDSGADITAVASALASQSRARMVNLMFDGRSHPAGDLAREAGVALSTASGHLSQLMNAGLVTMVRVGRQRRYRLSGPQAAQAIEALAAVAPHRRRAFDATTEAARLRAGRTCYDHLAGGLGIAITDGLVGRGALRRQGRNFKLTRLGMELFTSLGVDVTAARSRKRSFAHACLDWTEHRYHLGGALGAAVCEELFAASWARRVGRSRAVAVTEDGLTSLGRVLGIELAWSRPSTQRGEPKL